MPNDLSVDLDYLPERFCNLLISTFAGIEANEQYAYMSSEARALRAWNDAMALLQVIDEKVASGVAPTQSEGGQSK